MATKWPGKRDTSAHRPYRAALASDGAVETQRKRPAHVQIVLGRRLRAGLAPEQIASSLTLDGLVRAFRSLSEADQAIVRKLVTGNDEEPGR